MIQNTFTFHVTPSTHNFHPPREAGERDGFRDIRGLLRFLLDFLVLFADYHVTFIPVPVRRYRLHVR